MIFSGRVPLFPFKASIISWWKLTYCPGVVRQYDVRMVEPEHPLSQCRYGIEQFSALGHLGEEEMNSKLSVRYSM